MLNVGDIVKPKKQFMCHEYEFRINEIEIKEGMVFYKLRRILQMLNPIYGSVNRQLYKIEAAERNIWLENQLDVIKALNDATNVGTDICNTTTCSQQDIDKIFIVADKITYNYNKGGNNNMKILDIYKERKEQEIINVFYKEKQKIIQEDEIQKIVIEMVKQINVILENEDRHEKAEISQAISSLLTTETNKKIADLELKTDSARDELRSTLEEIRALFELTEDYQERMKILKKYDILNKDGKLSI